MIVARIHTDYSFRGWRSKPRRAVRLEVQATSGTGGDDAMVFDLSEHGLRIETDADLNVADQFEVNFPMGGRYPAEVVWVDGKTRGCKFLDSIPKSIISAAILLSPIETALPEQKPVAGAIDKFLDDTQPKASDRIWYIAYAALLLLLLVTAVFVAGILKSAMG